MKIVQIIILFLVLGLPVSFTLAQELNAGFVQGLWYSKTPFFAGETVRMYTAIQNNSGFDIQGTVEFLVNETRVGESSFSAINGRIIEVWTDWNVTQGNNSVAANIKEAFKVEIGKDPEPISLGAALLGVNHVFADEDTDQDNIGNLEDTDDDNDLLTDELEETLGTNPLDSDSDQDGLEDGKEVELKTDPLAKDTDQDGIEDGKEVELGINPLAKDTDGDGISDALEVAQGSSPIVAEQAATDTQRSMPPLAQSAAPEKSIVENLTQQITQEVLPTIEEKVDGFVGNAVEKLQEQRQELKQKKEVLLTKEGSEPESLSVGEQSLDLLLASAIVALPEWKIGLFLFFAILVALILRRFSKEQVPES